MATYTSNYNLKKPEQNDFYNVEDFNGNMDIVDSKLKEVSQKADGALPESSYTAKDILNKLKTVDGNGSGLDADLFKGQSVIPVSNGGTGKTTAKEAFAALGADYGFPSAKQMGDIDLNTIIENGYYFTSGSNSDDNVAQKHLPPVNVNTANRKYYELNIIVSGFQYRKTQIATFAFNTYSDLINKTWIRTGMHQEDKSAWTWTNWVEIFSEKSVIPIANGGTGKNNLNDFISNKNIAPAGKLSDVKTSGIYLAYPSSNYTDYPNNGGNFGVLVVVQSSNYVYQTFYGAFTSNNNVVINYRWINISTDTTTGWVENVNSINLPTMMNAAFQSGGVSVVKSIQKGVIDVGSERELTIQISNINPQKAFVILNTSTTFNSSSNRSYSHYLKSLTATNIVVDSPTMHNEGFLSWQVIEYY